MKPPDISSIARQSGVSIATVSRVLNNEHGVSDAVRRKTLAIMENEGYRPRANAKRATRLAMVVQGTSPSMDGFHSLVASGIFRYASEQNIETTLIHHRRAVHGFSLVENLRRKRCNGAIILASDEEDAEELSSSRLPVMYVANRRDHQGTGFIDCDGYEGTLSMMDYLIRLGHEKIAFLAGELNGFVDHQERLAAYYHAMKTAGLPVGENWMVPHQAGPTEQMGYELTRSLLARVPEITVIFANNDPLAWGAICAAVEVGRRVPENLSIVGFDDHPISRYSNPPLTTIRQPLHEMGYEAAKAVDWKLRGKLDVLPRRIMRGELIVRRSCAPAPRATPSAYSDLKTAHPNHSMRTNLLTSTKSRNRAAGAHGFSLVEVALALGIMAFAIASIVGLIPVGLTSFRQAMNNTVGSGIVQSLTNEISLSEFANLKDMAATEGKTYYFDADGDPLQTATGAIYTAQIKFTDLSPGSSSSTSPVSSIAESAGTTALITITKLDKTKDYFSVVVGNNRPVMPNATPATF